MLWSENQGSKVQAALREASSGLRAMYNPSLLPHVWQRTSGVSE